MFKSCLFIYWAPINSEQDFLSFCLGRWGDRRNGRSKNWDWKVRRNRELWFQIFLHHFSWWQQCRINRYNLCKRTGNCFIDKKGITSVCPPHTVCYAPPPPPPPKKNILWSTKLGWKTPQNYIAWRHRKRCEVWTWVVWTYASMKVRKIFLSSKICTCGFHYRLAPQSGECLNR